MLKMGKNGGETDTLPPSGLGARPCDVSSEHVSRTPVAGKIDGIEGA